MDAARIEIEISWPRFIAIILALGGSFWGVWLLFGAGPFVFIFIPTGVGYLVTLGYFVRAIWLPPLGLRQFIWVTSILVQGLFLGLSPTNPPPNLFNVAHVWWAVASVASIVASLMEKPDDF